ncbi:MAG TPA: hypothetical protein VHE35_33100 [Kofleriaceae bacterium]|nr:hypothetical protein [Kofleriaceae bacterium]
MPTPRRPFPLRLPLSIFCSFSFALSALALAACGLGFADDTSGGKDNLPATGAGPFRRPAFDLDTPIDEPWIALDPALDLDEPAALPRAGGGVRYWLSHEDASPPVGDTQIWAGALADLRSAPDPLVLALAADQPWEEGRVAAPAVIADRATDGHLIMFYEGGLADPAIGRADSFDDGQTWQKHTGPVIPSGRSPGAAWVGTTWLVALERPPAAGIWFARSADGVAFTVDDAPTFTARGDVAGAFDSVAIGQPSLAWIEESTGRGLWMMWYAGTKVPEPTDDTPWRFAIGYAASFDGVAWERAGGTRAILGDPAGAPTVVLGDGGPDYLLYAATESRRRAIGIATH